MPRKILICDNEHALRALVRAALEGRGYELLEASDGEESLTLARRERPDLIVLDTMMPGRSGLEVLAELRGDPELGTTRAIVLTARTQADDRAAAEAVGADDFIAKPFSPVALDLRVAELLARG
jgi:CheY-like chemotaxis protein